MATAQDVARFLGRVGDPATIALATEHLPMVTLFVSAYVRGAGFTDGVPSADLDAVCVSAAARMVARPSGVDAQTAGPFSVTYAPAVEGFTLMELAVLNTYRKRAA